LFVFCTLAPFPYLQLVEKLIEWYGREAPPAEEMNAMVLLTNSRNRALCENHSLRRQLEERDLELGRQRTIGAEKDLRLEEYEMELQRLRSLLASTTAAMPAASSVKREVKREAADMLLAPTSTFGEDPVDRKRQRFMCTSSPAPPLTLQQDPPLAATSTTDDDEGTDHESGHDPLSVDDLLSSLMSDDGTSTGSEWLQSLGECGS
jgi:hypothetical protein